jgi:hypothetical protein
MAGGQTYVAFRPDIWSPYVDNVFNAKLFAAKYFKNYSDYVTEGGKTIVIPSGAAYTATAITTTTGDITGNIVTDTVYRLDIDKWYGAVRVFADFQKAQVLSNYRTMETHAENMGATLAKALDSSLIGLVTSTSISPVVNASTAGIKSSDLEAAIGIMESYNIPREECIFFFHPKVYFGEVLAVQKLYDASQFGKPSVIQGSHDQIYGVPVVVTTQVGAATASTEAAITKKRNFLIHNRALAYAIGNLPNEGNSASMPSGVRMQEKKSENLRTTIVADIMYGVKQIGGSYRGVRLIGKN